MFQSYFLIFIYFKIFSGFYLMKMKIEIIKRIYT